MNTLYYGDNLKILREYVKVDSVDLIYLDPPFNSNRNYNVLFKDESGTDPQSQITWLAIKCRSIEMEMASSSGMWSTALVLPGYYEGERVCH